MSSTARVEPRTPWNTMPSPCRHKAAPSSPPARPRPQRASRGAAAPRRTPRRARAPNRLQHGTAYEGFSMTAALPPQALPRQGRTRRPDRVPMIVLLAALGLVILGFPRTVEAHAGPPIPHPLPGRTSCNSSTSPPVHNWYWTRISLPVQHGNPQNPDNSGAQFSLSDQCVLGQEPAWFGQGIPTYVIAAVTAQRTSDGCTITIAPNGYTDAVTPGCCSPPEIGSDTCTGPRGITNNHAGEPWPPQ